MIKENFEVYYEGEYYTCHSKVYDIDPFHGRFLVTDSNGYFKWVSTDDCKLKEDRND